MTYLVIIKQSFAMVKRCEIHRRGINNSVLWEQFLYGGVFYRNWRIFQ